MPLTGSQPGVGDLYVATLLSNVLVGFIQEPNKFMATRMFPNVPTDLPQGFIPQWKIGDLYRKGAASLRAPGTPAATVGFTTDNTKKFTCAERAVAHPIPDPVAGAVQRPYDIDRDITRAVGQVMLINQENDFINTYWKTGLWGRDWTGQATSDSTHKVFWDQIGSTPIEDVKGECDYIESRTGYRPNKLAIAATTFTGLTNNPEFLDRVKYDSGIDNPAMVDEKVLAKVFGVQEVIRAAAVSNTAAEGATDSLSFMAGKSALLVYAPPAPSIWEPSAGYTFNWTGVYGAPAGNLGFRVKKYRWERDAANYIEAQGFYDMQAVVTNLGSFFSNISQN